jgi:hypothetical protein
MCSPEQAAIIVIILTLAIVIKHQEEIPRSSNTRDGKTFAGALRLCEV